MSGDESIPWIEAAGYLDWSTSVELPGPQPRLTARPAWLDGIAATRSRTGRVRSSSNFVY